MGNDTKKCFVGIDPAFRKNGFAICIIDEDDTADFIKFPSVLDFFEWLFKAPENAVYCVENSNLQDTTFDMKGSKGVIASKSRAVGKNQAISQITVDKLIRMVGAENVLNLSPAQKGGKVTDNKTFLAIVAQEKVKLLNYKGIKDEQDERDSFMLAIKARKWTILKKRNG
jgi:hypothetical protein